MLSKLEQQKHKNFYHLYQGDCCVILPTLPDNSVHCVITDPPYGINFDTNHRKEKPENIGSLKIDDFRIFHYLPKVMYELKRVLKSDSALYCFCRWDTADKFKKIIERGFKIKNMLVWVKNNWSMGDLYGSFASQYECCFYAVKGRPLLNNRRDTDVLNFNRKSNSKLLHSSEKPEELISFLMQKSTSEFDTILDPFLGSGTTIKVSQDLRRNCIGIELDSKYIAISKKRCLNRQFLDRQVDYRFSKQ